MAGNNGVQDLFSLKRQSKYYAGKQPTKTGCFFSGISIESKREVFCQDNNHSGSNVHNVEKEKYSNEKVYPIKRNSQIQKYLPVYKYKKCKFRITGQMVLKTKYNISKLSSMLRVSSNFVYLRDNSENLHNRENFTIQSDSQFALSVYRKKVLHCDLDSYPKYTTMKMTQDNQGAREKGFLQPLRKIIDIFHASWDMVNVQIHPILSQNTVFFSLCIRFTVTSSEQWHGGNSELLYTAHASTVLQINSGNFKFISQ